MSMAYAWQRHYEEAVLQTDFEELPYCIAKTELAIEKRLADSPPPLTDSAEFDDIGKTLAALAVLKAQIHRHPEERSLDEENLGGYVA